MKQADRNTYHCKKCDKVFLYQETHISCCVIHPKDGCCHYGAEEVTPPPKQPKEDWREFFENRWYTRLAFPEVDMKKLVDEIKKITQTAEAKAREEERERILKEFESINMLDHHCKCENGTHFISIKREDFDRFLNILSSLQSKE